MSMNTILDLEYCVDITELRNEFVSVDINKQSNLKSWLKQHKYLTIHDIARVADVCHKTIYTWRRRANFKRTAKPPVPPTPTPKHADALTAPIRWDTAWLISMYDKGYSVPQLARATGVSRQAVRTRLLRRIKLRPCKDSVRSSHPCCNMPWIFEHYVVRGLSQTICANLAGVTRYTFSTWLDQHKIRSRSGGEQLIMNHANSLG